MKEEALIEQIAGKKILLYGLGREGISSLQFLNRYRQRLKAIDIVDDRPTQLPAGQHNIFPSLEKIAPADYDLLFKSPGIPLRNIANWPAEKITSQLDFYLRYAEGTIIGVTGTKGKSTTCALLHHMIQQSGRHTLLVGNIGSPALDFIGETTRTHLINRNDDAISRQQPSPSPECSDLLDGRSASCNTESAHPDIYEPSSTETITVYEMSSGQLETVHQSPQIAILLQLYPEHLDFHGSLEAYRNSKLHITHYQRSCDTCCYHSSWQPHLQTAARAIPLDDQNPSLHQLSQELLARQICIHPNTLAVALALSRHLGLSHNQFLNACRSYTPLAHRLEPIRSARNIIYYDDMLATLPQATIFSLQSVRPSALITGGHHRGADYLPLAQNICKAFQDGLLKTAILMPDTGALVAQHLKSLPIPAGVNIFQAETPQEAIALIERYHQSADTCLISPAAPSYNRFPNYEAKAAYFKQVIQGQPPREPVEQTD